MLQLRLATLNDLPAVMEIFDQARLFLKQNSIPQWQDGTPNKNTFFEDIKQEDPFLFVNETEILGIAALKLGPDPFYDVIKQGEWLSDAQYYTIHRFAMSSKYRGEHLSEPFFKELFEIIVKRGIYHVRIDTHPQNAGMQHVISKLGFQYCGIVEVKQEQSDPIRKAYGLKIKQE